MIGDGCATDIDGIDDRHVGQHGFGDDSVCDDRVCDNDVDSDASAIGVDHV